MVSLTHEKAHTFSIQAAVPTLLSKAHREMNIVFVLGVDLYWFSWMGLLLTRLCGFLACLHVCLLVCLSYRKAGDTNHAIP